MRRRGRLRTYLTYYMPRSTARCSTFEVIAPLPRRQSILRWILISACLTLSAYFLHTITQPDMTIERQYEAPELRTLQPSLSSWSKKRKQHDPEKWLRKHSNMNHYETGDEWFNNRPKAAIISLVRNEELEGILQSMRQLERHWNRRYRYPWIFFSEKAFTEEFKVSFSSAQARRY